MEFAHVDLGDLPRLDLGSEGGDEDEVCGGEAVAAHVDASLERLVEL